MTIIGIGIDMVELATMQASLTSPSFRRKVFSVHERDYCDQKKHPVQSYAGKFAVKEAVMKVLGAGIYQGVWFAQIEVLNNDYGKPYLRLHRKAADYAQQLAIADWHISITHSKTTVASVALAVGNKC